MKTAQVIGHGTILTPFNHQWVNGPPEKQELRIIPIEGRLSILHQALDGALLALLPGGYTVYLDRSNWVDISLTKKRPRERLVK